jgi:hypothetical protein
MATTNYTLSLSTWTAISTAGQSGTCFVQTGELIAVDHSTTGSGACAVTKAVKLYGPNGGSNILAITADGTSDIFYAIGLNGPGTDPIVLTSDVI